MRTLVIYAFTFIISFEFVLILGFAVTLFLAPSFSHELESQLKLPDDTKKWISLVPVSLLALTIKTVRSLIFPTKDATTALQKWPGYRDFRVVCNVAIVYAITFSLIGVAAWILPPEILSNNGLLISATSVVGSGITYVSVLFAEIKVNEVFAECSDAKKPADPTD